MRRKSKWSRFARSSRYKIVDLGRPFVFLIPERKLKRRLRSGITVEADIHNFLSENFGAFTQSVIANFGVWVNEKRVVFKDRCTVYEVSFDGKHKISTLLTKLAEIAKAVNEECIYCKAGQYSCLVYPKSNATD